MNTGAAFEKAIRSGKVNGGQYYRDATSVMAAGGFPIRSTFPWEGGVLDFGFWSLVEGSKRREAAETFLNYCSDPVVQTEITRHLGTAPVVPRELTDLSDNEYLAVSGGGAPIVPRYDVYVKNGDWIAKTWAKLIGEAN
jgi:putative spermidine/putrescine transport system substrate-binding protein